MWIRVLVAMACLSIAWPMAGRAEQAGDDVGLERASALLASGECETARGAFLGLAAIRGPLAVEAVATAFGKPCSAAKATRLPEGFEAALLAERGETAEAARRFEILAREWTPEAVLLSLDYDLTQNGTAPLPKLTPSRSGSWGLTPPTIYALGQAAWREHPEAMHELAEFLRGIAPDALLDRAVQWEVRAAEMGYPPACLAVGRACESGQGLPRDQTQAARWYERAARGRNAQGMRELARLYESGRGLPRDQAREAFWMCLAARFGHREAAWIIEDWQTGRDGRMPPEILEAARNEAANWVPGQPEDLPWR